MFLENGLAKGHTISAIQRILNNLQSNEIPLVLVGDSRNKNFPHDTDYSNDGSREVVESYNNTILFDKGNYTQIPIGQVNQAFRIAAIKGFRYVLILGCDEWIEGSVAKLQEEADKLKQNSNMIQFIEHNNPDGYNHDGAIQRLFAHPMFVRTRTVHYIKWFNDKEIKIGNILDGITIHSDDRIRPQSWESRMKLMQERQIKEEHQMIVG